MKREYGVIDRGRYVESNCLTCGCRVLRRPDGNVWYDPHTNFTQRHDCVADLTRPRRRVK